MLFKPFGIILGFLNNALGPFNIILGFFGLGSTANVGKPLVAKLKAFKHHGGKNFYQKIIPDTNRTLTFATKIQFLDSNSTLESIANDNIAANFFNSTVGKS